MKILILILLCTCLLASGCMRRNKDNLEEFARVFDETGNHRLRLRFSDVSIPDVDRKWRAFDFHSLLWESKSDSKWEPRATITRSDFQTGSDLRRWISEVHSFSSDTGRAIIKVGEEGLPDPSGRIHVAYSWREWDLLANKEVRMIEVCESPSDKPKTLDDNP